MTGNRIAAWAPRRGNILRDSALEAMIRNFQESYVIDGYRIHETSPNSLHVTVDAGWGRYLGTMIETPNDTDLNLTPYVDADYPKIVIIYVDGSGAVHIHDGTAESVDPAIESDWLKLTRPAPDVGTLPDGVPLAEIYLEAGAIVVEDEYIESITAWHSDGALDHQGAYNLLQNGSFEVLDSSYLPVGWATEGSPTIANDTGEKDGQGGNNAIKITATGAANEGIKFTLKNLKNSTIYSFRARAKVTSGDTASVVTTGATTNISLSTTSTTWVTLRGQFVTDSNGTDVVLKLLATASGDIVWFDHVAVIEGQNMPAYYIPDAGYHVIELPAGSMAVPTSNGATFATNTGTYGNLQVNEFDQTTEEFLEGVIGIPDNIKSDGTVIIEAIGYPSTAAANKYIQLKFYHSAKAKNESWDAAYGSVSSGDLAVASTANLLDNHRWTSPVSTLDWVAGDQARIRISRIAPVGTNLTGDYHLTMLRIKIPRSRP